MISVTAQSLKNDDKLKDVPLEQLDWLVKNSRHYELKAGDFLFKEEAPIIGTHFIISGKIKIFFIQNGSMREVTDIEAGAITGYLPFSRGKVAGADGQATEDSQIMTFPIEMSRELIVKYFELTQALVHVMTTRVRDYTALAQQNEKMMALGKLSAGLAHELNNPAAAIVRGSISLKKHLNLQPETFKKALSIKMTGEQVDAVSSKLFEVLARKERPALSLMERTDKEDDLAACLDDHGVDNGFELAENFVDFGFTDADIDEMHEKIPVEALSAVLNWVNNNLVTEKMVADIQDASQRISDLVASVKNFTHMDRAGDMQFSDIHTGLKNTLVMLNHKIKTSRVEVTEEFDVSLPQVKAMVGELNQVWTNLIDNALDAMEGREKNKLLIRSLKDGDFVKVSIIDNGPGIPEDILANIFDPFFTTKDIGKGTGLGLDVVSRIVKQHRGTVKVNSVPGRTEFVVCFPFNG
jgi:signal transduction histidine kinase